MGAGALHRNPGADRPRGRETVCEAAAALLIFPFTRRITLAAQIAGRGTCACPDVRHVAPCLQQQMAANTELTMLGV